MLIFIKDIKELPTKDLEIKEVLEIILETQSTNGNFLLKTLTLFLRKTGELS